MKKTKFPQLRTHVRKGKNGQVWTYWTYDRRAEGLPELPLGRNYAQAIATWRKLHDQVPLTIGRLQQAIDKWREEVLPAYTVPNTRHQYRNYLLNIERAMGHMGWDEITMQTLYAYISKRSAKTSANREMSTLALVWQSARKWGMTDTIYPALGLKGWKNKEKERKVEVTDAMFAAVYEQADRVLRDAMDIATATGMRITDVRTIRMPVDGVLRFKASKTAKVAEFEVAQSPVLSAVVARREAMRAHCVMLLCTDTGRQVSEYMLSERRWTRARAAAIAKHPELKESLQGLYLRDLRKRAADLAEDREQASKLLQHSSVALTDKHYRTKAVKLRAVR
jgi:hypothetical protein